MSKQTGPPRSANTITKQLRWFLKNCGTTPREVARQIGVYHASLYRFLNEKRGLSDETADKLAKYLNLELRLVRDRK